MRRTVSYLLFAIKDFIKFPFTAINDEGKVVGHIMLRYPEPSKAGISPTGTVIVRTGRTASTLLTYCECANDVLKLSPYSFGGLLVYL